MTLHGYGKILDIDLSTGNIVKRDIDPKFAREFVGGMGFSCKILYDEVGTDVDPLGPDNIVIFAVGPLTGTSAPCSGRTEITTKSPLTGHIGTGNTGGVWGVALKRAGFDLIIVRKQAEKPVYLWIDNDAAEIREASHLWGKDTRETSDILKAELDTSQSAKVSVLAIGQAGENLVRYACTLNDSHHVAARNGAGAVMGAKKLKAIAVRGMGTVPMARPQEFRKAAKEARERIREANEVGCRQDVGTAAVFQDLTQEYLDWGLLPGKNYQTPAVPRWTETRGQGVALKYITGKESTCYGCPMSCFDLAEVNEGKHAGVKAGRGAHPGVVVDWGAKCAIDNLPAIWKCKELCQQYGMDYVSPGSCVAFAMELFERGIITTDDTDGLELTWGNEDAAIDLLRKIAFREGFGDILAEGIVRAAKRIGRGAEQYALAIKGMEMMGLDPRGIGKKGLNFGNITNPRGSDNLKTTHGRMDRYTPNWWVDKFDIFEDAKEKMYSMPGEECTFTWEGKPMMSKWSEELYSVLDALGLCFFPSGMIHAFGPTLLARLYSACTGWETTAQDIMMLGERIFAVMKAYTVREGLSRKDDNWPDRFYDEPQLEGPTKGAVLSRDEFNKLLDEYYELKGWDKITGLPTAEKFIELGLSDIAKELVGQGKIPAMSQS